MTENCQEVTKVSVEREELPDIRLARVMHCQINQPENDMKGHTYSKRNPLRLKTEHNAIWRARHDAGAGVQIPLIIDERGRRYTMFMSRADVAVQKAAARTNHFRLRYKWFNGENYSFRNRMGGRSGLAPQ